MANAWYPLYKQNLLAGTTGYDLDVDTATDGPFCSLQPAGYVYATTHGFYDMGGASDPTDLKVGSADQRLTAPTVTNGTFDGSDLTYTAVTGSVVTSLVIYRHNSGAGTTWPLALYLDTGVTGLPVTPNGGNITIQWSNTAPAGLATLSDARLKEDIRQVGRAKNGLPIYEFRYIGQGRLNYGLIAQDVLLFCPEAVTEWTTLGDDCSTRGPFFAVDYEKALSA